MTNTGKPLPIDYRRPAEGRRRYVDSAEEKQWRYIRILFRVAIVAVVAPIVVHFGANYFAFGYFDGLTIAHFVPIAQRCVPAVRAMKEYQRDTGHLPRTMGDLQPIYIPKGAWPSDSVDQGRFIGDALYGHVINYDFRSGSEHWEVSGPLVNGRIPLPPVTIGPTTTPWVHP